MDDASSSLHLKFRSGRTVRVPLYFAVNAVFACLSLIGSSKIGPLSALCSLLYAAAGIAAVALCFTSKRLASWTILLSMIVWDAGLQETMPYLTRAFTPLLVIAVSLGMLQSQKGYGRIPSFAVVMLLASFVSITHYVIIPDQEQILYLLMVFAAALMATAVYSRPAQTARVELAECLRALTAATAFLVVADVLFAFKSGVISPSVFRNPDERLGIFGFLSGNSLAYFFGLGTLACAAVYPTLQSSEKKLFRVFGGINLLGLLLTKSLSSITPVIAIVLFRVVSDNWKSLIIRKGELRYLRMRSLMVFGALVLLAGGVAIFRAGAMEALDTGRDYGSFGGRFALWYAGIVGSLQSPLFGLTQVDLADIFPAARYASLNNPDVATTVLTPHNVLLDHALHVGIPITLGFLISILWTIAAAKRCAHWSKSATPIHVWILPLFMLISNMLIDAWNFSSYAAVALALFAAERSCRAPTHTVAAPQVLS